MSTYTQEKNRLIKLHWPVKSYLKKEIEKFEVEQKFSSAMEWLKRQDVDLKLGATGLFCHSDDQSIKDFALAKAAGIERRLFSLVEDLGISDRSRRIIRKAIRAEVEALGFEFPLPECNQDSEALMGAFARLCDATWWRRQARTKAARQIETYMIGAGLVTRQGQIYCSDYTLARRTGQRKRNKKLLEGLEAENADGQTYTLAELADLSTSNPINKRNELMVRIRGFEEYAAARPRSEDDEYRCLFMTITCPSKYHRHKTVELKSKQKIHVPNKNWSGYMPDEANDYLCKLWAQIRAKWDRLGVRPFGFRMAEPHADGCPHWHMVLFVPQSQVKAACREFGKYALREDGDEWGALNYRSKIIVLDPSMGGAAAYCAKYVAKNIDGFAIEADLYGRDAVKSAMRIEAWATTWGIRQFQQIGGASVTIWREARRVDPDAVDIDPAVKKIVEAARESDWDAFTDLMGGVECRRDDRPLRPFMLEKPEQNKYREFVPVLIGLLSAKSPVITRSMSWKIRPVTESTTKAANERAEIKKIEISKKLAARRAAQAA